MGLVLSYLSRFLSWKPGKGSKGGSKDHSDHHDNDDHYEKQSQLILPFSQQQPEESYFVTISIDHPHPDPDPDPPPPSSLIDLSISTTSSDDKKQTIDHPHPDPPPPSSLIDLFISATSSDGQKQTIDHPHPDFPPPSSLIDLFISATRSDDQKQITAAAANFINIDHHHHPTLTKIPRSVGVTTTSPTPKVVVKRIGPYRSDDKILLVGEGDFSFSACLATAFGSASNMVATSLNTQMFLSKNYKSFTTNKSLLVNRGCLVLHEVDATRMANHHPRLTAMKFDCVVFNFPHTGFASEKTPTLEIKRHQKLISGFLRNAKRMINEDGQIHIRHKCNWYFLQWNIPKLGCDQGLILIQEAKFNLSDYPGYNTKYGFGGDNNFNCHPSKTYKFGLPN